MGTRLSQERHRFLAEVGALLDSSLDYQQTLDSLARLAVPVLADWCVVDFVDNGRLGESLAVAHRDPRKVELARELQRRWPADANDMHGVPHVIRSGEPELYPEITDETLAASAKSEEHLRVIRELGPWSSGMVVPLKARGNILGAMTLIAGESGRQYGQDDLEFAIELASRAALAVDNAHLFAAEQRARAAAERLQELTQQLSRSLDLEDVLQEIATTAAKLLDAPVAGVFLIDPTGEFFDLVAGEGFDMTGADIRLPRQHSAAGGVIASGQPAIIADASAARVTALPRLISGRPVGSLLVVPIVSRSGPLGVIEVYSRSEAAFDEQGSRLLSSLAAAAATALENARLYAAEQRARHEAERLQALTQQLGQSLAADVVLQQVAATAAELLESPVAGVFLLDESQSFFELAAGKGLEAPTRLPRQQSLAGKVIGTREAVAIPDVRKAPVIALPQLVSGQAVGSLVVAPIISSSGPLGVIEVYSSTVGAFEQHHADLLAALAGAAAAVLVNARLYRERELDLARLRTIVEQLPVGMLVAEAPSGRVTVRNRQAEHLYGSALEDLQAGVHDLRRGFHPDGRQYAPHEWPLARAITTGELVSGERIRVERPDGGTSWLSINAAPICDASGQIVAAVTAFDDVSGEAELRRQKEQFLAAAAHDLKTPLTSIQGLVQLLERQLRQADAPRAERVTSTLAAIGSSTRKMNSLIEELLDLSRLDTMGDLSLNRGKVDLVELAGAVVEAHRRGAQRHQLQFEASPDAVVGCWDEARLERVLSNLVGNAVKYSPDGGEVRISVTVDGDNERKYAVVSVRDPGIGIPAGDVERIFERFQRGSNVPDRIAGSGVGLAYVRHIVEQHGGSISVCSEPGVGTAFSLRLPKEEVS